jgi:hypothetical protein
MQKIFSFQLFWLRDFVKQFTRVVCGSCVLGLLLSVVAQLVCNDRYELK